MPRHHTCSCTKPPLPSVFRQRFVTSIPLNKMNFFRALIALLVVITVFTSVSDAAPFFGIGRRPGGGARSSARRSSRIGNRIVPDPYAFVAHPGINPVFPAEPLFI
ncbi:uncharacterized protein LOC135197616 [Macrobrachium nipponense]|uniref:uncharacterized protein LOC135197616 n=1 Tax=Macrobrachium nipponense TaxID=159736 RepID=UPI0030C80311